MSDDITEDERELQADREWALREERDEARRKAAAERPRVVITCDGTEQSPHRPVVRAMFAVDSDGTLLPINTATRDDGKFMFTTSGLRAIDNKFEWDCTHRGCHYRFRHPADAVCYAILRLGRLDVSLRQLDEELRRA